MMMSRENQPLWRLLFLLIILIHASKAATVAQDLTVKSTCQSLCGDVSIPYPFGIGEGCYLDKWYEITCKNSTFGTHVPFLPRINKEVVHISLNDDPYEYGQYTDTRGGMFSYGSIEIKSPITSRGCSSKEDSVSLLNLTGSPFYVGVGNTLVAVGCNTKAMMTNVEPSIVGCTSSCDPNTITDQEDYGYCNGYWCCQATIPSSRPLQVVGVTINGTEDTRGGCRAAFLTNQTYFSSDISEWQKNLARGSSTVNLWWFIAQADLPQVTISDCFNLTLTRYQGQACFCGYPYISGISYARCRCNGGYRGNPYLPGGCKDIDECSDSEYPHSCGQHSDCVNTRGEYKCVPKKSLAVGAGVGSSVGFLILVGLVHWLYKFIKKRKEINRRKKFFKRNGGLLLQQQLNSSDGNVEKTKVFNQRELEKATESFSKDRVLGQGGQGTVYKGMLVDGRIVAVKKSKVVDEDKLEEFINEVVILSQINHRNIVKLLGCCLETDVPLLVYEFIPNGDLFEHLHDGLDDYTMTWEARLRVSIEIAGALSYLHSAASCPVYHRDIKSTNILLDEKYRAKVSDFGTSRSVTIDHTHLTTVVSGTVGYVDPEYFQSSQFTDKSDVYSFGVVLVELITGEKAVSLLRFQENRTLATHFIVVMKENKLSDIIDARIKDDCKFEQVVAVANLARRCLNLKGNKRPSMREVSVELERIRSSPGDTLHVHMENGEENEAEEVDIVESWNIGSSAPASDFITASSSSLDIEPLFPRQTW